MLIEAGDKVMACHRRLYERDEARYFVGVVDAYDAGVARVTGHTFVRDALNGRVIEKADQRTKLLSLSSGALIVYVLPNELDMDSIRFNADDNGRMYLTDEKGFLMNLGESAHAGRV